MTDDIFKHLCSTLKIFPYLLPVVHAFGSKIYPSSDTFGAYYEQDNVSDGTKGKCGDETESRKIANTYQSIVIFSSVWKNIIATVFGALGLFVSWGCMPDSRTNRRADHK